MELDEGKIILFSTSFVPVSFSCWLRGAVSAEKRSRHNPLHELGNPTLRQRSMQSLRQPLLRFQQDLVQGVGAVVFLPVMILSADKSEQKSGRERHRTIRIASTESYTQTLVLSPKP